METDGNGDLMQLAALQKAADAKQSDFEQRKKARVAVDDKSDQDNSRKAFYREFKKVVEAADVIIQVRRRGRRGLGPGCSTGAAGGPVWGARAAGGRGQGSWPAPHGGGRACPPPLAGPQPLPPDDAPPHPLPTAAQVLDARDPLACRCLDVERHIRSVNPGKRIILLLNKMDLVPREVGEQWLTYFRQVARRWLLRAPGSAPGALEASLLGSAGAEGPAALVDGPAGGCACRYRQPAALSWRRRCCCADPRPAPTCAPPQGGAAHRGLQVLHTAAGHQHGPAQDGPGQELVRRAARRRLPGGGHTAAGGRWLQPAIRSRRCRCCCCCSCCCAHTDAQMRWCGPAFATAWLLLWPGLPQPPSRLDQSCST
jgi:hypothetical protein